MAAISGIYRIRNTVTRKVYIGSAIDVLGRLRVHKYLLRHGKHHSIKLQRSWNKHGPDAFLFELVEKVEVDDLDAREQYYIDTYSAASSGYNILPNAGSCRGRKLTAEHRAKIGNARRGKPRSAEVKAKISAAQKGRPKSPEHLANTRAAMKLRKMTPEHLAALTNGRVAALTGRPLSAEHRAKISRAHIGMTLSAETRAKISATKRGL